MNAAHAGTLAAVGVSLALHAGMAAFLAARLPRLPEPAPDFAVTVSLAVPGIVLGGSTAAPLAAAAAPLAAAAAPLAAAAAPLAAAAGPAIVAEAPASRPIEALAPTPAPVESVAAEPAVASLAASADVGTPAPPEVAAAVEPPAPSSGSTPPAAHPSAAGTETPQSAPALLAPAPTALESPAAVSAGSAVAQADVKPAPPSAAAVLSAAPPSTVSALPDETPHSASAMPAPTPPAPQGSGAGSVDPVPLSAAPLSAAFLPAAAPTVQSPIEALSAAAPPLLAVSSTALPAPVSRDAMPAAVPVDAVAADPPVPVGTPAPAARIAAAEIHSAPETIPATLPASVPVQPLSDAPPSLAPSAPQQVAQAARPPDGTLNAHEESEAERAWMIQSFIDRYDGGACFFAAPSETVSAALDVDSFAADKAKFRAFDEDFKTAMGRESHVQGQRIWTEQCPVVDLLQAGGYGARVPVVRIDRTDLREGDILSGTIRTVGTEPLHLYLVSETGQVDDLTASVRDRGDLKTFAVPIARNGFGGPFLQLLVAVSTGVPPFAAGTKADKIFPAIRAEAARTPRSGFVGARSFLLQP